jgi:hypothetical protein
MEGFLSWNYVCLGFTGLEEWELTQYETRAVILKVLLALRPKKRHDVYCGFDKCPSRMLCTKPMLLLISQCGFIYPLWLAGDRCRILYSSNHLGQYLNVSWNNYLFFK